MLPRWLWGVLVVLVLLAALWLLAFVAARVSAQSPEPPVAPPPIDPAYARDFEMALDATPRRFTAADIGRSLDTLTQAYCEGRWSRGPYRYFVNGTSPSALVGALVPALDPTSPALEADGTLELDGETVLLWDVAQVRGFAAVAATSNGATIAWVCQLD